MNINENERVFLAIWAITDQLKDLHTLIALQETELRNQLFREINGHLCVQYPDTFRPLEHSDVISHEQPPVLNGFMPRQYWFKPESFTFVVPAYENSYDKAAFETLQSDVLNQDSVKEKLMMIAISRVAMRYYFEYLIQWDTKHFQLTKERPRNRLEWRIKGVQYLIDYQRTQLRDQLFENVNELLSNQYRDTHKPLIHKTFMEHEESPVPNDLIPAEFWSESERVGFDAPEYKNHGYDEDTFKALLSSVLNNDSVRLQLKNLAVNQVLMKFWKGRLDGTVKLFGDCGIIIFS